MGAFLDALNVHSPAVVWGFNEPSGSVVQDLTANNRDGTLTGGTRAQASPIIAEGWTATLFDGSDDRCTRADEAALEPAAFSLIAVVKRNGAQANWDAIAIKVPTGDWLTGYGLYWQPPDVITGFAGLYTAAPVVTSAIANDTWVMATLGYEGSTAYMNVNGVDVDTSSPGVVTTSTTGSFDVGLEPLGGAPFAGTIACVALIPTRLTEAQLATIYAAMTTLAGPANNLKRYM